MALQHLRSSTASKRPTPASMSDGQLALNTNDGSPGLFFKDSNGGLVKVGPVHVGATAPNASPASGGSSGNSVGEQWLDTSGTNPVLKIWDGSAWQSESGEFVNVSGDVMTGALGIIAGTAGAPGLYVSGDTNTGIYSPGADQVAISTNGTQRLLIDSSGNVNIDSNTLYVDATNNRVGLGTSSVSNPFTLVATTGLTNDSDLPSASALIKDSASGRRLGAGTSSTGNWIQSSYPGVDGVAYNLLLNPLGGRVGIGTTSPVTTLQVGGASGSTTSPTAITLDGTFASSAAFDRLKLYLFKDSTESYGFGLGSAGDIQYWAGSTTSGVHRFFTSQTERARIDSSGRLLVGTSTARSNFFNTTAFTPQLQLEGVGTAQILSVTSSDTVYGPYLILARQKSGSVGGNTAVSNNDLLGSVDFQGSDGTEFIAGGQIKCEVDGTPGANDMPGRLVFSTTADGASSPTERMRITNDGFTTFGAGGTTVLWNQTSVNGVSVQNTGSIQITRSGDTTLLLNRSASNGDIVNFYRSATYVGSIGVTTTATSYNTSSDYRLKENVVPLVGAITRVNQLQVHRFNFIGEPEKTVDGFLAHEAQAVVPECVTGTKDEVDADGNPVYQGIDQSKLVPLLTAALQEAIAKIETLEAKVAALEAA